MAEVNTGDSHPSRGGVASTLNGEDRVQRVARRCGVAR